ISLELAGTPSSPCGFASRHCFKEVAVSFIFAHSSLRWCASSVVLIMKIRSSMTLIPVPKPPKPKGTTILDTNVGAATLLVYFGVASLYIEACRSGYAKGPVYIPRYNCCYESSSRAIDSQRARCCVRGLEAKIGHNRQECEQSALPHFQLTLGCRLSRLQ